MKHALISIILAFLVFSFAAEATSPPHCFFEPTNHIFFPGQRYVQSKPNGWCLRRVTCKDDYNLAIEECSDIPCLADANKGFNKEEFPECCCGDVSR